MSHRVVMLLDMEVSGAENQPQAEQFCYASIHSHLQDMVEKFDEAKVEPRIVTALIAANGLTVSRASCEETHHKKAFEHTPHVQIPHVIHQPSPDEISQVMRYFRRFEPHGER